MFDVLYQTEELEKCRADGKYWCKNYVQIYESRPAFGIGWKKFDLWPKQEELWDFFDWAYKEQLNVGVEKCRGVGVTKEKQAWNTWHWLFDKHFNVHIGSRSQDEVDKKDDPGTLFAVIDGILEHLPAWMLPFGLEDWRGKHRTFLTLKNPINKNTITGEACTANFGRSNRGAAVDLDEYQNWPNDVFGSVAHVTSNICAIWTADMNHVLPLREKLKEDGRLFTFNWFDNPNFDERWFEKQKRDAPDYATFAREVLIDYESSTAGRVYEGIKDVPIGDYPYNPKLPLITFSDWGIADNTYIGFLQVDFDNQIDGQPSLYLVDEIQNNSYEIEYYVPFWPRKNVAANPFVYTESESASIQEHGLWKSSVLDIGDPAGKARQLVGAKGAFGVLRDYGINMRCGNAKLVQNIKARVDNGRLAMRRLHIDKRCTIFLKAMRAAHFPQKYEGSTGENYRPVHDWTEAPRSAWEFFSISENLIPRPGLVGKVTSLPVNPWRLKRA